MQRASRLVSSTEPQNPGENFGADRHQAVEPFTPPRRQAERVSADPATPGPHLPPVRERVEEAGVSPALQQQQRRGEVIPAIVRGREMARRAANVAQLQQSAYLEGIATEAHQDMVRGTHGPGACKRAGKRVLDQMFGVGPQAAGFDERARGLYDDLGAFLGEAQDATLRARLIDYARVCMVSTHLAESAPGSEMGKEWEALIDAERHERR